MRALLLAICSTSPLTPYPIPAGNNDAQNGCLVYTDEMISALEEMDGGEELEFYKQGATERNITYQKAAPTKTADGLDGHTTVSYRTWRWNTLVICTNRGGGFSKGNEEPSKVKQAMINRSQAVHVRKHDGTARPADEFQTHQARPEVQRRRRILRITTNLTLLTRMMLLFQPHLRPDMTIAQRMWKEWDQRLEDKFGLVGLARRRNDKRTEDCVSAAIWEAVWEVFGYKQTSLLYPSISKRTDDGKLPPFHPSQLYEVVRILQPSQEVILDAWTRNLELSISTSTTGCNVMSMLAEAHNFDFTSLLCRSKDGNDKFNVRDYVVPNKSNDERPPYADDGWKQADARVRVLTAMEVEAGAKVPLDAKVDLNTFHSDLEAAEDEAIAAAERAAKAGGSGDSQPVQVQKGQPETKWTGIGERQHTLPKFFGMYPAGANNSENNVTLRTPDLAEIHRARKRLKLRREATSQFRKDCLGSSSNGEEIQDIENLISNSGRSDSKGIGVAGRSRGKTPGGATPAPQAASSAVAAASNGAHLSRNFSCIAPDVLIASIFYSTTDLLHWCIDEYSGPKNASSSFDQWNLTSGTHPSRHYVQLGQSPDGKTRYDFGWVRVVCGTIANENEGAPPKLKGCPDYRALAHFLKGQGTQKRNAYHEECVKDALYMLGHNEENSRMVPQMPTYNETLSPYKAMIDRSALIPGDPSIVKPIGFSPVNTVPDSGAAAAPTSVSAARPQGWAKPRDPEACVDDTDLQRRVDGLVLRNRLFAASIVASNKILRAPPIRIRDSEVNVNAGILTDHCALLAEATLAAAAIPGLKNAHEMLPDGMEPPPGLCTSEYKPKLGHKGNLKEDSNEFCENFKYPGAVATHGPKKAKELFGILAPSSMDVDGAEDADDEHSTGDAPQVHRKRKRDDDAVDGDSSVEDEPMDEEQQPPSDFDEPPKEAPKEAPKGAELYDEEGNNLKEKVYALPYSYDLIQIHLGATMASLLYDDEVIEDRKQLSKKFKERFGFGDNVEYAQVTLPFPGYVEIGRQLISLARRLKPNATDGEVIVRDEAADDGRVDVKYVSACLGRPASMHEVREWCSQRAGSSQYYGIEGNLFAQSLWRRHALAALKARGMIASSTETAANIVRYRSSQLWARLVEHAAEKGDTRFLDKDGNPEVVTAEANSYRAVEEDETRKLALKIAKRQRPNPGDVETPAATPTVVVANPLSRDPGEKLAVPSF